MEGFLGCSPGRAAKGPDGDGGAGAVGLPVGALR